MTHEPGVQVNFNGGLGNRMFQLTAGYIVHSVNNLPLYLNKNHNPHSNINYMNNIFKYYPIENTKPSFANSYLMVQSERCFSKWDPKTYEKKIRMEGYFQYYPPIKQHETVIRELFLKGLEAVQIQIRKNHTFDNIGFLHIRRGDYLNNPNLYYIQSIKYYENAVDLITKSNPNCKFYIISNDINWVKSQAFFSNPKFIIFEGNEIESMALMSLCKSAAICANSTFSWWGAFLGAYEKRNPVICPKKFVNMPMCENIFPDDWILI